MTRSQNRIDLIHFLTYLKLNQVSIYNQLYKTLVALFRAEEISPSSIIGENMNKKGSLIKISELEKNLPKNDFLELLDYYMVFGSLEEKSQHLSEKDLKNILSKLLKTNLLPLRKKLFQWASSKESVATFFKSLSRGRQNNGFGFDSSRIHSFSGANEIYFSKVFKHRFI